MNSPDQIPFNDLSRTPPEAMAEVTAAIARVVASGWYVMGPEHGALETELAEYLGVAEAVLVANGTDALELALAAVGVERGDRVLTVANAGGYATIASRLLGAIPIYCDVSPTTLLITGALVEAALASAPIMPKAIVVTHLYGAMAPIDEIVEIAHRHGVLVVEDCAQSIGARTTDGRQSGSVGDIATTSFYPTKNLGALGDGGAVFTNSADLANRVRRMRQYGWSSKYHIAFDHGRNSRMDEIQAAIIRVKLPHLDALNERRREIHARYRAAAPHLMVHAASSSFTGHLAILLAEDRDSARASLRSDGVNTDVHYPVPDHLQAFPANAAPVSLPATEAAAERIVSVPLFPELTENEIVRITQALARLQGENE